MARPRYLDTSSATIRITQYSIFQAISLVIHRRLQQVRHQDFRGPDFFAVLGVPKRERKSWVVWQEGKGPDVVIELLSESTAAQDKEALLARYQERFGAPPE